LVVLTSLFVSFSESATPTSKLTLPSDFSPPQVFKNTNLLRSIDLTKSYARERTAIIVEPISKEPQTDYYIPFASDLLPSVSSVEAFDRDNGDKILNVAPVEFNDKSVTQYYRIQLDKPLSAGEHNTILVVLTYSGVLEPVPALIAQNDKQYLKWSSTQYSPSVYLTEKQKTKLKLNSADAPEFTKLEPKSDGQDDPTKAGSAFTYGPYGSVEPLETGKPINVRYEYTKEMISVDRFERDIEVSQWGGNLAIEERYWITNIGAKLSEQFSRVSWAAAAYYNPPTSAIKQLTFPLKVGAKDAYFTDEIGNVSTSRFRTNAREAHLELKPRYPIFGGWNYSFVVGWNHDLKDFLKVKPSGEDFVLKVPFLDGPKESLTYKSVDVTIILPEGATNVEYDVPLPIEKEERYLHKTFMDTIGRTAIKLSATNMVDDQHHREITVKYHLPRTEALRKPLVLTTALMTLFTFSWMISKLDVRIGK